MDKKQISQKEYLKKYLSSGKDKKKVKKKKPNLGAKTVKIIDDDIDLKNMRAIEDGEFDIYANTEDGPQIAGIIDERGPVDFSDKKRWKIITDDGFGDISVTSVTRNDKSPRDSSLGDEIAASNPVKNHSQASDSDCSPPRRSKKGSDSDETPRRKFSSKKKRKSASDLAQNQSGSEDGDISPPRKSKKTSHPDETRRKKSSKKKRSVKNDSGSGDSDISPPRKSRKNSDSDEPRRKKSKSKKQRQSGFSPVQNNPESEDSDFSPPRRPRKDSDSDLSPPRNLNSKLKEGNRSRDEYTSSNSNSRKKLNGKHEKGRENSRWSRYSPSPSPQRGDFHDNSSGRGDSHRPPRQGNGNNKSPEYRGDYRSRESHGNQGASRREKETPPRNKRKINCDRKGENRNSRRGGNDSASDLSPPRESKRKYKNLELELSSKDNRKKSRNFDQESGDRPESKKKPRNSEPPVIPQQKTTFKNYQEMSAETSGFGQAPVLRDRKTGRRRDLAAEAREKEEKDEKRQELEEKYAQWGRGLKQVEDRQEKLDRDLYEMTKPLARYADDEDLERELKAQDREGDPMLAYMKKKHKKEGKQEPEKPKYNGPSMPNRFGIRPGYRWDGVDRSNGYEKKWFDAQNARKAVQEEAYKWSTADM